MAADTATVAASEGTQAFSIGDVHEFVLLDRQRSKFVVEGVDDRFVYGTTHNGDRRIVRIGAILKVRVPKTDGTEDVTEDVTDDE
jgi:hypothetical protein